jgi:hypothetical protein
MDKTWYNWYYYENKEIQEAKDQIALLESRKEKIILDKEKRQCSGKEKEKKIKGIQISIDAIKYKYTIE